MKYDALRFRRIQFEYLREVPGDSLPLAVFIGSEPYRLRLAGGCLQLLDKLALVCRYLVDRREVAGDINAHLFLFQIAYVTLARHDLEVGTKVFLYRFCFCR